VGRSVNVWIIILVVAFVVLAAGAQQKILPETVLAWSAVVLVALVSYRVAQLYLITRSNSQVVISDFGNSSGIAALDPTMPGLSLLARQSVLKEMLDLREKVRVVSSDSDALLNATLPSAALDTKLTDLTKALSEGFPENAKPAAQLLSLLLTPRGMIVVSRLQLDGDTPGRVGISLEVADIEGLKEPRSDTFWESLRADDEGEASGKVASGLVAEENCRRMIRRVLAWLCECLCPGTFREDKGTAPKEATSEEEAHVREARALYELGALYERRAAYEQAKVAYEEAAKKNPDHPAVREALLRMLKAPGRTLSERYRALLGPVCRWQLSSPGTRCLPAYLWETGTARPRSTTSWLLLHL
jgi:hypothetical protein